VSPDAVDDALPATAGTSTLLNVLANDAAPLNPVVGIVGAPANGAAVANGDGSISYTPNAGYTGADAFTYQLCLPAPGGRGLRHRYRCGDRQCHHPDRQQR
jgi:hypothetical protein